MKITRSTKISLAHINRSKKKKLKIIINYYIKQVQFFVDLMWEMEEIPKKTEIGKKDIYDLCPYKKLNSRWRMCAARQARGLVSSSKSNKGSRPKASKIKANLNQLIELEPSDKETSVFNVFACIIGIRDLLDQPKLELPIKLHVHFNILNKRGWKIKKGFVLTEDFITVVFEKEIPKKVKGEALGVDLGKGQSLITTSDGKFYGEKIRDYTDKLSNYKARENPDKNPNRNKKTKGYKRKRRELEHYIDKTVKDFLDDYPKLAALFIENLKNMNKKKSKKFNKTKYKGIRFNRGLSKWAYRYTINRLISGCEERGISWRSVSPYYTSQICFKCSHLDKNNRKGSKFSCNNCDAECHADINAANNILEKGINSEYNKDLKDKNLTLLYSLDKIIIMKEAA